MQALIRSLEIFFFNVNLLIEIHSTILSIFQFGLFKRPTVQSLHSREEERGQHAYKIAIVMRLPKLITVQALARAES